MWGVENAECGKCGVWKMRSVENAGCGKCQYEIIKESKSWKMRSVENVEQISIFHFNFRRNAEKQCVNN